MVSVCSLAQTARCWRRRAVGLLRTVSLDDWHKKSIFYSRLRALQTIIIPDYIQNGSYYRCLPVGENKIRNRLRFLMLKSRGTLKELFIRNPVQLQALQRLIPELPESLTALRRVFSSLFGKWCIRCLKNSCVGVSFIYSACKCTWTHASRTTMP